MMTEGYVKEAYFTVTLVDIKEPLFKVAFDLENIDFDKIYNKLREKNRNITRYILFRKLFSDEILIALTETLLEEDIKNKILDIINKDFVHNLYGVLDKPAVDFIIVNKGIEKGEVFFIIKPITKKKG